MRLLCVLLLPLSVFAQQFSDPSFLLFWDAAKTDTQFAVIAADSLTSQPFRVKSDMSCVVDIQVGDTSGTPDSTKLRVHFQYAIGYDNPAIPPDAAMFNYAPCGVDSIGIDSTKYDVSSGGWGRYSPPVNISTGCPVVWTRCVLKGLATNQTSDSTKGTIRVLRYSTSN